MRVVPTFGRSPRPRAWSMRGICVSVRCLRKSMRYKIVPLPECLDGIGLAP